MTRYAELPVWERVPDYHLNSPQSRAIIESTAQAALEARAAVLDAADQLWVSSATWGLPLWETLLAITPEPGADLAARRRAITAKMRGAGTCNQEMISNVCQAITGHRCLVIEHPESYTFSLVLVGDTPGFVDVPTQDIIDAVEPIKPAHLQFIIEGITWRDLEAMGYTWAKIHAEALTWYDIENKVMVQKEETAYGG